MKEFSLRHGFLAENGPVSSMPASHQAWDRIFHELTGHLRNMNVRAALNKLPVLSATPEDFADAHVKRAILVLSFSAHALFFERRLLLIGDKDLPDCIRIPWMDLRNRLGQHLVPRILEFSLYGYTHASQDGVYDFDTVKVSIPIFEFPHSDFGRVMSSTLIISESLMTPSYKMMKECQDAQIQNDVKNATLALENICENLRKTNEHFFHAIGMINQHSDSYYSPLFVPYFLIPFTTSIMDEQESIFAHPPWVTVLDAFLGRFSFKSGVGVKHKEASLVRSFDREQVQFILGLANQSKMLGKTVGETNPDLLNRLSAYYVGDNGFLDMHRRFTLGTFQAFYPYGRRSVLFQCLKDQQSNTTHTPYPVKVLLKALAPVIRKPLLRAVPNIPLKKTYQAIEERQLPGNQAVVTTVLDSETVSEDVKKISFDVKNTPLSFYRIGDKCAILPVNSDAAVDRLTQVVSDRTGVPINDIANWKIRLNGPWPEFVQDGKIAADLDGFLSFRRVIQYGRITSLDSNSLSNLHKITGTGIPKHRFNETSDAVIDLENLLRTEEQLSSDKFQRNLCAVIDPLDYRWYSICSPVVGPKQNKLSVLIAKLDYTSIDPVTGQPALRHGVASSHLHRLSPGDQVRLKLVSSYRFRLPEKHSTPVIMICGGVAISPFIPFIHELCSRNETFPSLMVFLTKDESKIYFKPQLEDRIKDGRLVLEGGFSRQNSKLTFDPITGKLIAALSDHPSSIDELIRNKRALIEELLVNGTHIYVCGRVGFGQQVFKSLQNLVENSTALTDPCLLEKMKGRSEYVEELFTSYQAVATREFYQDEVIGNRDVWHMDDKVYDISAFRRLHPGGEKVLLAARKETFLVVHGNDPRVRNYLQSLQIGVIRSAAFSDSQDLGLYNCLCLLLITVDASIKKIGFIEDEKGQPIDKSLLYTLYCQYFEDSVPDIVAGFEKAIRKSQKKNALIPRLYKKQRMAIQDALHKGCYSGIKKFLAETSPLADIYWDRIIEELKIILSQLLHALRSIAVRYRNQTISMAGVNEDMKNLLRCLDDDLIGFFDSVRAFIRIDASDLQKSNDTVN